MLTKDQLHRFDSYWNILLEKINRILADHLILDDGDFESLTSIGEAELREAISDICARLN